MIVQTMAELLKMVRDDASTHPDVEVLFDYHERTNTMFASYEDDAGKIKYHVHDTRTLVVDVQQEAEGDSSQEIVDAFWRVMNEKYKNQ